jgi:hypothetical protein
MLLFLDLDLVAQDFGQQLAAPMVILRFGEHLGREVASRLHRRME